ncbi:hypothetical protein L1887_23719 [Cichorium endivia]|nr:hypothetical protein L1887_23719 [Cichorium endivia]
MDLGFHVFSSASSFLVLLFSFCFFSSVRRNCVLFLFVFPFSLLRLSLTYFFLAVAVPSLHVLAFRLLQISRRLAAVVQGCSSDIVLLSFSGRVLIKSRSHAFSPIADYSSNELFA